MLPFKWLENNDNPFIAVTNEGTDILQWHAKTNLQLSFKHIMKVRFMESTHAWALAIKVQLVWEILSWFFSITPGK